MIILDDQDPHSPTSSKSQEAALERSDLAGQSSTTTSSEAESNENTSLLHHAEPPPAYTPSPNRLPQPAVAPGTLDPEGKFGSRAGLRFAKAFAAAVAIIAIFNVVEILIWRRVEAQEVSVLLEPLQDRRKTIDVAMMLAAGLASSEAPAHTAMAIRGGRPCAAMCQCVGLVAHEQPSSPYFFSLARLDLFIFHIPWRWTFWRN
jgi:hypothetical protein